MNSGRKAGAIRVQTGNHQYEPHHAMNAELEDVILKEGVRCSVKVGPDVVTIKAASFSDYVLAKSAIRGRVSQSIIQG